MLHPDTRAATHNTLPLSRSLALSLSRSLAPSLSRSLALSFSSHLDDLRPVPPPHQHRFGRVRLRPRRRVPDCRIHGLRTVHLLPQCCKGRSQRREVFRGAIVGGEARFEAICSTEARAGKAYVESDGEAALDAREDVGTWSCIKNVYTCVRMSSFARQTGRIG